MRIFACVLYNYSNVVVLTANAVSNLSLATGGYSQTTYYNKKNLSHLVDLLVKISKEKYTNAIVDLYFSICVYFHLYINIGNSSF